MSQQQNDAYFTNLMNDGTDYEFMDEPLDQGDQSSPISPQIETTKKPQRGGNFTTEEDSMLISAWLNISLDPVQGNEQKSKAYWLRVWEYFHQYKTFSSNCSQTSLMNRWSAIQLATNKFSGCFAQIQRLNQSGKTDKDKVLMPLSFLYLLSLELSNLMIISVLLSIIQILDARKLYKELYKSSFPFEHCWHELRDQPKWREEYSMKKQKPKKVATPGVCSPSAPDSINLEDHDVSHNDNVDLERPPGRKAEKERLNKRKNKDRGNEGGSPILILLEDLKEDRKKMNDKKIEMYERSYLQEQEKIDNEKKRTQTEQEKVDNEKEKIRMEQLKEEERIMSIDTSGLPSLQAECLHRRQMEILQKKI
ncbi:glutathione S-transferase T3-like [Camellia sinensis]|uniref:glutathione S-transferase T3-like n=1 Tax=Camellia sinensis TaxID=4442 RepID=UPI001035A324|nr:glutathione S-transferase T3-like [Camellia sinensis]